MALGGGWVTLKMFSKLTNGLFMYICVQMLVYWCYECL